MIVDRYTKIARYIPTRKTIDAPRLADIIANKHVLRSVGILETIVSDRGTVFTAKF